jgi:AmmeMemoRadiSam system protein B
MFYPAESDALRAQVEEMLAAEATSAVPPPIKAVIAPHAGYVYSGPTAAAAFGAFAADAASIRRIVLLGPAHRVAVRGLAVPSAEVFATPLGRIRLDLTLVARVAELPQVAVSDRAHALEHSLEVELPFLQRLLPSFQLLPLVVGDASAEEVAEVLEAVWGGEETRIVVSSDLSHYHPYDHARRLDRQTADRILALEPPIAYDRACGAGPINGLLTVARRRGLEARLVDLRNSGDTAGDRDQVVGYGAFSFAEAA